MTVLDKLRCDASAADSLKLRLSPREELTAVEKKLYGIIDGESVAHADFVRERPIRSSKDEENCLLAERPDRRQGKCELIVKETAFSGRILYTTAQGKRRHLSMHSATKTTLCGGNQPGT